MFVKIASITLITFFATSIGAIRWNGLTGTWAENPADGFFSLPQNWICAKREGWTEILDAVASDKVIALGYYGDPRITLLYAKDTGAIMGLQIGMPVVDIEESGFPINYDDHVAFTRKKLNGKEFFTATAYFQQNGDKRQLWFVVDGELEEIPTDAESVIKKTPYYAKRCVTWMGLHFYQIDSNTNCSEIFPWVLLRLENDIIGITFQAIGNSTSAPQRKWFETIPTSQLVYTVPDAPTCLGKNLALYGLTSFHLWLIKDPLDIDCSGECTAVRNSTEGSSYHASGKRLKRAQGSGNVCP